MSTPVVLNGQVFTIPSLDSEDWAGPNGVDGYLIALASGVLSKAGGSFTLTGNVNFGGDYGLLVAFLSTRAANAASAGLVRASNDENTVAWRNAADDGDLVLKANASDELEFDGTKITLSGSIVDADIDAAAAIAYSKLALADSIVDADINSSAAISYSKLNLATSIVDADVSTTAAIAYSKLNLATSIVDADISSSAAIAYSKLALASSIVDADVSGTAAIAYSKLNLATSIVDADISSSAAIAWSKVSKTGSNLTDIDTRSHTSLTDIGTNTHGDIDNHIAATSAHGVSGSVVGTTDTQTLDNKTLASPAITSFAQFAESSTPSTPSTGQVRLYPKTDGNFYKIDSNGVELPVGSGGGGAGEINAIENSSAASAVTGWDAATNYTVVRNTTDSPLAPTIPTCFEIATTTASSESSTSAVGVADFTMPVALRQMTLKLDLWVTTPATADGVWRVSLYKGSTRVPFREDTSGALTLPGGYTGKLTVTFDTDDSATYSLRFTQTTRTNANKLFLTGVVLGPGIQARGAIVGEWQALGPITASTAQQANALSMGGVSGAGGFGTVTENSTYMRRVGSDAEFLVTFRQTTAGSAISGDFVFNLPLGMSIDTTKAKVNANTNLSSSFGAGQIVIGGGTPTQYLANLHGYSATRIGINGASSTFNASNLAVLSSTLLSNQNFGLSVYFKVPIAEWAGSGTVNLGSNDVEYAANSLWDANDTTGASTIYGPNGAAIGGASIADLTANTRDVRVLFRSPIQPSETVRLEIGLPGGGGERVWLPFTEGGAGNNFRENMEQATAASNRAGMGISSIGSNFVTIRFNIKQRYFQGAAQSWIASSDNVRWRVVKAKAGAAVGFGLAQNGESGLINYYNESSFTSTFTFNGSGGTTGAINISAIRVGKLVTVHVKEGPVVGTGTNSNTLASNTAIPAWARPGTTVTGATPEIRIGTGPTWSTNGLGRFRLGSDGIISIARDNQGSNWPNTTSGCGVNNGFSISYTVD
jgi:hypothetical protein